MSANTEAQGSGRGLEAMKWIIVAVLLIVAIVGNFLPLFFFAAPLTAEDVRYLTRSCSVKVTTSRK